MTWDGGGACGSSNQDASAHCLARPGKLGDMYLVCVHSAEISRSSAGDRVTASPDSLVLLSCGVCSSVLKLCNKMLPGSLRWLVHSVGSRRCTVTVSITSGVMASGKARGGRFRVYRSGVNFRYELQTSWNARESFLIIDSPHT